MADGMSLLPRSPGHLAYFSAVYQASTGRKAKKEWAMLRCYRGLGAGNPGKAGKASVSMVALYG